jgi:hypothetical protein
VKKWPVGPGDGSGPDSKLNKDFAAVVGDIKGRPFTFIAERGPLLLAFCFGDVRFVVTLS